ncbi:MAG: hypothetical protein F6K04_15250 [Leptolyngbya sp. SIO4C5]|uniref:hypothetical protein n=1 Tax=Sphaerothrix gracilis TaxID=3151835 RepID=UPI0013C1960F|nr:hypothetical protein [Leptolyngbya sp. SIO4C5]
MKEKVKSNPESASTQDAKAVAEAMVADAKNAPAVDFDSDYEMAQKMSRSETDAAEQDSASTAASDS